MYSISRLLRFGVFFHRNMYINSSKTKSTDTCSTRGCSSHPRSSCGIDINRRVFNIKLGIRLLYIDGRWQYFMVERQNCFNDSCRSCCCFGVPNLRFDRTQCYMLLLWIIFPKYHLHGIEFCRVTCASSCPVCL